VEHFHVAERGGQEVLQSAINRTEIVAFLFARTKKMSYLCIAFQNSKVPTVKTLLLYDQQDLYITLTQSAPMKTIPPGFVFFLFYEAKSP